MKKESLEKGLAALQHAAEAGNGAGRRAELLEKAQTGELTAEENEELIKSLGGGSEFTEAVTAPLQTDTIQKSLDVSDYLREHHEGLEKSLTVLAERIEKSEVQDQNFRIALAQTVTSLGDMVKSLHEQVQTLSGQPAGPVLSAGVTGAPAEDSTVQKSFAGQPPGGSKKLSKGQVLDLMEKIGEENNGLSKSGENMSVAIAKYEGGNEISKSLHDEVIARFREESSRQSA